MTPPAPHALRAGDRFDPSPGETAAPPPTVGVMKRLHPAYTRWSHDTSRSQRGPVVQLPVRIDGRVALARRGLLRNPEESAAPEVEGGTEDLRGRFRVRSSPGELAERLLDERVCEWLTGPGRGFHYEIVHDRVLAYGWRRWLGGTGPLRAALGLAAELTDGRRLPAA